MSIQPDAVTYGAEQWDMRVLWVDPDEVVPNEENPNEEDDRTFNALVESIQTDGWRAPAQAVWDDARQRYVLVAGEHRWKAAKVLGCLLPVIPLPPDEYEKDRADWSLVKDNLIAGKLNPEKFAKLYDRMARKYDAEVLQSLMGFTSEDAFRRLYKTVKSGLPKELQEALEGVKDEIRTIDDLSLVLNRLFRDHGETLPSNFMTFSWGGKEVLWVRCDDALWKAVKGIADEVTATSGDMTSVLKDRLGV